MWCYPISLLGRAVCLCAPLWRSRHEAGWPVAAAMLRVFRLERGAERLLSPVCVAQDSIDPVVLHRFESISRVVPCRIESRTESYRESMVEFIRVDLSRFRIESSRTASSRIKWRQFGYRAVPRVDYRVVSSRKERRASSRLQEPIFESYRDSISEPCRVFFFRVPQVKSSRGKSWSVARMGGQGGWAGRRSVGGHRGLRF